MSVVERVEFHASHDQQSHGNRAGAGRQPTSTTYRTFKTGVSSCGSIVRSIEHQHFPSVVLWRAELAEIETTVHDHPDGVSCASTEQKRQFDQTCRGDGIPLAPILRR